MRVDITDREKGIEAIIYLQSRQGINEPREVAERNWDDFSDHDKEQTLVVYRLFDRERYYSK